ncbi:ABC transporter ATP-binding protein [Clostridiisalibacter paucivorans]|uniref:ABC transporter ATP-binding protein n=1 Tax=Clostridiisalibacter paucivorans TaxID=408753 RepID=UPI00047E488B|nr:ABC transporter ATP-binding protein [Clostridiisalibacter paucivorans]
MDYIISAYKLNKEYTDVKALKDVSINIDYHKFYGIMGPSGSGKTTLINMLGLLDTPNSGEIYINNVDVSKLKEDERAKIRMKKIGFIFQAFYLNPSLKAFENVMIPMYINPEYGKVDLKEKAINLLNSLGLSNRINHFPRELSAGEQQRVAIARALANDPQCIIADEPTGNLDTNNETIVLNKLKELTRQGKSVIVVSHNEVIDSYADKIYHMSDGCLEEK